MLAILARSGQYLPRCLTFGPHNGPEDFGFATDHPPETGVMTASYVPPEVLRSSTHHRATGEWLPYTHACDLWSLGVTLYVCCSGIVPFFSAGRRRATKLGGTAARRCEGHVRAGTHPDKRNLRGQGAADLGLP